MANEQDAPVLIERDETIATLILNRPAARNALSRALVEAARAALAALADDPSIRALIVTGAGDKAFCAGADLIERQTMTAAALTAHTGAISAFVEDVAAFPAPVIAAIRGFALAGGAELALACDLRVAAVDAMLGFPEVKIGVFPGAGGVVRLPRVIGTAAARDLLYTGRSIGADEALRLGLVDRVVPTSDLLAAANALAREIAANAPLAVRAVKRALIAADGLPAAAAGDVVNAHRRPLDATADYQEGLRAFAERRKPVFRGQ